MTHQSADLHRFLPKALLYTRNAPLNPSHIPKHAIFPIGLTRLEAIECANERGHFGMRHFIYDARNGRASWL